MKFVVGFVSFRFHLCNGGSVGAIATSAPSTIPETGNRFIDQTHDALLRQVRDLRQCCAGGGCRDEMAPRFCAFVDEVQDHFRHEETILRAIGYGGWSEHADQHEVMVQQMGRLVAYLAECDCAPGFMSTVASTLDAVLCRHEIKQDAAYTGLLNTRSRLSPDQPLIVWEPGFQTGIERVDAQHQALAGHINALHRMAGAGSVDQGTALALLARLAADVRGHFAEEEALLHPAVSNARFLQHQRHHRALEQQLDHVRRLVETGVVDLAAVAGGFLRFWLIDHVVGADTPLLRRAANEA